MKKVIAQLLVLTLIFSSFAVFPAGALAAEEAGDAVYYNRTYDEAGKELKDGLSNWSQNRTRLSLPATTRTSM